MNTKGFGISSTRAGDSYNNLAITYGALGEHQTCLDYLQKALAIEEMVLPAGHPSLAMSYNNLAITQYHSGDLDQAGTLLRRAISIYEKALLPTHPRLLQARKDLAFLEQQLHAAPENPAE